MTKDEIRDIRQNLRDALEALDELDSVEAWTDTERTYFLILVTLPKGRRCIIASIGDS